jgi:ABC-2 type transport system ATP-binding protein
VYVSVRAGGDPVEGRLGQLAGVTSVTRIGEPEADYARYLLKCEGGDDIGEQVFRVAVESGWTINELRRETPSLEDIFLKLTTKEK